MGILTALHQIEQSAVKVIFTNPDQYAELTATATELRSIYRAVQDRKEREMVQQMRQASANLRSATNALGVN